MLSHSEILDKYGIRAKKSLGQNFLVNDEIIRKIANAIPVEGENIIEVGPGYGALTVHLLEKKPNNLTLIELDSDMVYTLERRIENEELIISSKTNFLIQKMDVLKFQPEFDKYSVIANIPYYITSPILYHFLYETSHRPGEMIILLQQDVGDKIRKTRGNKSSVLSLFIDLACERVEEVCQVSAGNFVPAPKVESAILRFVLKKDFNKESAVSVLSVIKKGFAEKRKKLLSNLEKGLKINKDILREIFTGLGLGENTRAEELDAPLWQRLHSELPQ